LTDSVSADVPTLTDQNQDEKQKSLKHELQIRSSYIKPITACTPIQTCRPKRVGNTNVSSLYDRNDQDHSNHGIAKTKQLVIDLLEYHDEHHGTGQKQHEPKYEKD
jgi:hypothetical protein